MAADKEYVERWALKDAFNTDLQVLQSWDVSLLQLLMIEIDEAPAADVAPVVHGEWCWISDDDCICSICGKVFYTADNADAGSAQWKYCPNCGARMDGERKQT